ncbi:PAS domain S-box protein [Sphingomonas sp. BK069]|uniref:PAS domain S-box protein n=1 Tax=Sphingomonas sp. BK069 TaxID=2586979 RepID=UPI001615C48F|nr:PAS domain S-box protein [Sphingomonas sp. BK069]MBB3348286.1 PAS domain S-box-containing protein [Sphingomonas sp. BK069]
MTDTSDHARIAELTRLAILDTPAEQGFDDAVALVRTVCDVPIALVSLVDRDRQWFKAASGVTIGQTGRDTSVCSIAIEQRDLFVIPDLSADPRTASMSLVTGPEQIRFYAGVPLVTDSGIAIGTLCAIDTVARPQGLDEQQRAGLLAIGRSVTALISARVQMRTQERRHAQVMNDVTALESMLDAQRGIWPITGAEPLAAGRERAEAIARAPDRAALFSAIQSTRMPMILTDPHQPDNPIIFANRSFLALSGYREEELVGRNCRFLQGPGTDPSAVRRVREAIAARETIAVDILNYRRDGSTFVNELYVSPVFDGDGNLLYFFGSQVDVTSLTQARADLQDSEARYRSLFEAMDEGFCIIEFLDGPHGPLSDYVHVEANEAYERNAGIANVVGQKVREMVPDEADSWVARYGEVLRTGEPIRFEQELVATGRQLELSAFRLEPAERRQVAVLFQDITERRRAENELRRLSDRLETEVTRRTSELLASQEALRQSQKMEAIGQLTGGVAHDFNNLLTIIRSAAELLTRADLPETKRQRYATAVLETTDRAAKLTGQLLAFARRQPMRSEVIDAGAKVQDMLDLVRQLVGTQIEVTFERHASACHVETDPAQLETALLNLSANARDAMKGSGCLSLKIESVAEVPAVRHHPPIREPHLAISVTDTGPGIPDAALDHIFEPFFTTKDVGKGTGLGLSQVFGFAKQSGGEVGVRSSAQGAIFTIYLPCSVASVTPDAAGDEEGDRLPIRNACILVVEDNVEVGTFSTEILRELGHKTEWAPDAASALAMLEAEPDRFDLVFSDVMMPGMTGIELGIEIGRLYPSLPVLLTSGYSSAVAEGGTQGFELLSKPYSVDELTKVLARVLRSAG